MGIKCNIAITNIQVDGSTDLKQIIQKRLEYIRYGQSVPKEDIPLEYVGYDPITVDNAIYFADLSSEIKENSQVATYSFNNVTTYVGNSFNLNSNQALITNRYVTREGGVQDPLFYAHELPADTATATIQKVTSVGGELIPSSSYELDAEIGYIFASFQNAFDEISGRYTLYFVESMDVNGSSIVELWNGAPAFHEATFNDINPDTGWLYEDANAYIITVSGSSWHYSMSKSSTYFVKGLQYTIIRALEPTLRTAADPWFAEVTNGSFSATIDGTTYAYSIPEYSEQNFSPMSPFMLTPWEKALKVNKETVKLQREDIHISPSENMHLELIILDKDGVVIHALTTDTSKNGSYYSNTDVEYDSSIIDSYDNYGGILSLVDFNIRDSYELRASYYYKALTYTFTDYNINPLYHSNILDFMFVIYIVPGAPTGSHALYYLLVKNNYIHYCSQVGDGVIPNYSQYNSDGTPNPNTVVGMLYETFSTSGLDSFREIYPYYVILAEVTGLVPDRPHGGTKTIASSS